MLDIDALIKMKREFDSSAIPLKGRTVELLASQFKKEFKSGMVMCLGFHINWINDLND